VVVVVVVVGHEGGWSWVVGWSSGYRVVIRVWGGRQGEGGGPMGVMVVRGRGC
jgi:hypothetical protein